MKRRFLSLFTVIAMLISLFSITAFATNNGTVLYDKGGIKITYQDYTVSKYGDFKINLLIENNSSKYICVRTRSESLNGFMQDTAMSDEVQVGKKKYAYMYFPDYKLEANHISTINDAQFSFRIFEKENWDTIDDSKLINLSFGGIKLNNEASPDKRPITAIYNKDGIKISYIDYIVDDYGDLKVNLFIENNSPKYICVQARNESINGFMISATMSNDVQVGKKAYADMTFSSYRLKGNHISSIKEIEFSLHIFENDDLDTIDDSQLFKITSSGVKGFSPKGSVSDMAPKTVTITIPEFSVKINGNKKNNATAQYPYILYNNITYCPMTYNDSRFLGLASNWSQENGLEITKLSDGSTGNGDSSTRDKINSGKYSAVTASGLIRVNGKIIDNFTEDYPLLVFRDVTYFPLTWRFAVTEFGWDYNYTNETGLTINCLKATEKKQDEKTSTYTDNDMYKKFVDFVTTKGSIGKDGTYGIQTDIPYYSGSSGKSYGTITLVYNPDSKELQLQILEYMELSGGDVTTLFATIDLPKKSTKYNWQFQYMIDYASYKTPDYFMASEGTLKADVKSYLSDDAIKMTNIITGKEITEGSSEFNVGALIDFVPSYGNKMFSDNGSSLSFDYFGII